MLRLLSSRRTTLMGTVAMAAVAVLTLGSARAANAQAVGGGDSYAVTDFVVRKSAEGIDLAGKARDAVRTQLASSGKDVLPQETVTRALADLGFRPPVDKNPDLIRLGQRLGATYLVTGTIYNYRVVDTAGGKQGQVIVQVVMRDVASGLTVNGASLTGNSGVRTGEASMDTLLSEALEDAAFHAVRSMNARVLPTATVTSTLNDRALINQGTRTGFTKDQRVIVRRMGEQVAEGILTNVDPDSAFVRVLRFTKGIQPGDRVVAIFDVPTPTGEFSASGDARQTKARRSNGNQGVTGLVILLAIVGVLFLGGRGGSQAGPVDVQARAIISPADVPGVQVSWRRDSFLRGRNEGPFQWQVYRDGIAAPVAVVSGDRSSAVDDTVGTDGRPDFGSITNTGGSGTCNGFSTTTGTGAGQVIPGTPYRYSVELVYRVSGNSLPGTGGTGSTTGGTTGGTGGTTGGTGGTTGGTGGTTGGTGGTTGGTGGTTSGTGTAEYCYFVTARVPSSGFATPLTRPELRSPQNNALLGSPTSFQFTSVRGQVSSIPLEYTIQFSTSPNFLEGQTFTSATFTELTLPGGQLVSSSVIDTSTIFPTAGQLYWRVGVRNPNDAVAPVGNFVFSAARVIRRN